MTAHLHKTELADRVLYSDGDSVVPVDNIMSLLSAGANTNGIYVDSITDDIAQFNKFVAPDDQIKVKTSTRDNDISWNLPQEYADIDPAEYVIDQFNKMRSEEGHTPCEADRQQRLATELSLYKNMGLFPVLTVLIYIINTLREKNVVWGVGRGSSVSSYVLYIMGVHDVDSVEYDLDIRDFLRS